MSIYTLLVTLNLFPTASLHAKLGCKDPVNSEEKSTLFVMKSTRYKCGEMYLLEEVTKGSKNNVTNEIALYGITEQSVLNQMVDFGGNQLEGLGCVFKKKKKLFSGNNWFYSCRGEKEVRVLIQKQGARTDYSFRIYVD